VDASRAGDLPVRRRSEHDDRVCRQRQDHGDDDQRSEGGTADEPTESSDDDPTAGRTAAGATPPAAAQLQQQGDAGATPPPAAGGEPKPEQKYITAFGDVGARWFLEKKPIEECVTEFTKQLKVSHSAELGRSKKQFDQDKAALQGQLDAANQKLAAIGRGDGGVTFSNADGGNADPKPSSSNRTWATGHGRFARHQAARAKEVNTRRASASA
jgi:hypothetical protein